jgi:hypothetical protein
MITPRQFERQRAAREKRILLGKFFASARIMAGLRVVSRVRGQSVDR